MIPVLDLQPEIAHMRGDLDAAFNRVMSHGRFIMGPEVREFEKKVAGYLGVKHAIGVNSGTDALLIALRAAGVGKGDEVITTSFTFFATAESIEMAGATPVFVDIEPVDYNMDPGLVEAAITPRTRAIVPVHLFGKPAAMARIMEIADRHGLLVIDDCAQSFGAVYRASCAGCERGCSDRWRSICDGKQTGTTGIAGAFSFFPSKNLGGFGDGGMITTNDDRLAETAAMLRVHGARKKYHNEVLGYNSRLDTLQAALLQVKLDYIDEFNERRRKAAHRYIDALSGLDAIKLPVLPDDGHVYHQFTIQLMEGDRDRFVDRLQKNGIQTMVYYPVPCHQLPLYLGLSLTLPQSEAVKNRILSLPIGPFLSESDQDKVIGAIRKCL